MYHRLAIIIALALTLMGCQSGSVSTETVARCYPEGACDEAMFQGGIKGGVADLEVGSSLFQMHCASCHGVDGKGLEKTKRHDFTSAIWHASRQDLDIADAILRGRAPMMPPISLSESQLRDVISHVRSLKTAKSSSDRPSGSGY
jgi:mono/diheme cytochrome c family protein